MSADTKASTAQCCVAAQRYAMADDELFESIDPDIPLGKRVRQAYRDHGASAAKSVLAEHYRSCAAPPGWVALAGSPAASLDDRTREQAELALAHVYGGPAFETRPTHQFASPINWLDNPTSKPPHEFDKQWSMRFLAMPWWEALSRAYQVTGDERYASEFVAQFLDFRRQHPMPLEPSAWDDRLPLKYTVPEWRTFEIARRLLGSWTNSFFRFRHARAMTDEALCEMLKSFAEMAHHLDRFTPRAGGVSNNWTVLESLALYTAGIFWPEFRQARVWKDHGEQRLLAQLDKQIYPDGVHWELSPSYAMEVLQYYLRYIRLAQLNGEPIPDRVYAPVHRLADSLAYSSVAGSIPAFGDGVHKDVQPVMEEMLELFPDRQDIRWIVTSGQQGQAPSMASCAFPYGGVYVMRSGWSGNDCAMVITAGPHGVAHQHEDCLSFELYAFGDWLIIDPGKYRYNYDSIWRQYMIGSLAHNTLAVDRMGQSRQGQPSTWVSRQPLPHRFEQGDDLVRFQGIYSDGYGPDGHNRVGHVRSIYFLDRRYWVLIDRALPLDDQAHCYESLFHLNNDPSEVTVQGQRVLTRRSDGPNLMIVVAQRQNQDLSVVAGQREPVLRGWRPDTRGPTVTPCPTVCLSQHSTGDAVFAAIFYPLERGQDPPQSSLNVVEADREKVCLEVRVDGHAARHVCDPLEVALDEQHELEGP